jgi:hypothetical protein
VVTAEVPAAAVFLEGQDVDLALGDLSGAGEDGQSTPQQIAASANWYEDVGVAKLRSAGGDGAAVLAMSRRRAEMALYRRRPHGLAELMANETVPLGAAEVGLTLALFQAPEHKSALIPHAELAPGTEPVEDIGNEAFVVHCPVDDNGHAEYLETSWSARRVRDCPTAQEISTVLVAGWQKLIWHHVPIVASDQLRCRLGRVLPRAEEVA